MHSLAKRLASLLAHLGGEFGLCTDDPLHQIQRAHAVGEGRGSGRVVARIGSKLKRSTYIIGRNLNM